ncbi:PAS domain-containing protein [Marinomonas mediterranea]|jgi:PAS domain S-box|uniref:Methyl-accepting chemotaxis sensory transducer with Pas/Pac sensor n=2 Tax=Marinomonas mediterranea TaxID=119864 RepID=F2K3N2_MARM1|nr:methyl-accepting chemotaxis sensory transducer with Pas/Pac sensor [Marinomonas mediterranea MMB-1]WCN10419.1 PAS domain-containing protein [Marinomonas mediterranea]WCN18518.1 PAS domain-containing protein [Marinomonas mediterranea MMB-1]
MRKMPVTNRENDFSKDMVLVSSTDVKGRITFVNDAFCSVAGYERDQLIGAPHNLIRHPDVPPAVFADMWANLKQGNSWMGLVKNRCENGDHYWVSAHVSPLLDNGKVIGYESVRRKATVEEKKHAQSVYDRVNAGKSVAPTATKIQAALFQQLWISTLLFAVIGLAGLSSSYLALQILAPLVALIGIVLTLGQRSELTETLSSLPKEAHNPIGQYLYCKSIGSQSAIRFAQLHKEAAAHTFRYRLAEGSLQLRNRASEAKGNVTNNLSNFSKQRETYASVASATSQMLASVNSISENVRLTAEETEAVSAQARESQTLAQDAGSTIRKVYQEISDAKTVVDVLAKQSDKINELVSSISDIAEQTNLLALNAAIESARAGEAGRGFAVVADEVRALAIRTQNATQSINDTTEELKQNTNDVFNTIDKGTEVAQLGVERINSVAENMVEIDIAIGKVVEMTSQINVATNEQTQVAEALNEQMHQVEQLSLQASERAQSIVLNISHIEEEAYEQGNLADRMKQ